MLALLVGLALVKGHQQRALYLPQGSIVGLNDRSLLIDTGTIPSMVDTGMTRKLNLQAEPSILVAFGQQVRQQDR